MIKASELYRRTASLVIDDDFIYASELMDKANEGAPHRAFNNGEAVIADLLRRGKEISAERENKARKSRAFLEAFRARHSKAADRKPILLPDRTVDEKIPKN